MMSLNCENPVTWADQTIILEWRQEVGALWRHWVIRKRSMKWKKKDRARSGGFSIMKQCAHLSRDCWGGRMMLPCASQEKREAGQEGV